MNIFKESEVEIETKLNEIRTLKKVHAKVLGVLKAAKFGSIAAFVQKLEEYRKTPTAARMSATEAQPKGRKKGGIKRTRMTDAQIAKMKTLRAKKLSFQKVANAVGCSPGAVVTWEGRNFKRD